MWFGVCNLGYVIWGYVVGGGVIMWFGGGGGMGFMTPVQSQVHCFVVWMIPHVLCT